MTTDPEFKKAVGEAFMELTASGEYSSTSPRAVYRAAERAAWKLGTVNKSNQARRPQAMTGEAPRSNTPSKPQGNDRTFEALSQMFGIKDKEGMKKNWEAHKATKGKR
jgi:hypothetical protein